MNDLIRSVFSKIWTLESSVKTPDPISRSSADLPVSVFHSVYPNLKFRKFTKILFWIFCILFILIWFLPWQQTSQGAGRVVAYAPLDRQQTLEAPLKGRISRWHVSEGSRVKKGDPIAEISDNDPNYLLRLEEARNSARMRLEAEGSQTRAYRDRIGSVSESARNSVSASEAKVEMAKQKVHSARAKKDAAQAERETAKINLERNQALFDKGLVSKRTLELAELSFQKAENSLTRSRADLEESIQSLEAEKSSLEKSRHDANAARQSAEASLGYSISGYSKAKQDLQKIEAELSRQFSQSVVAPRDGTIMRILTKQDGEQVFPGEPIAILIPDTESRAVELYIDGNDIPLVREGSEVRLQFQGWPVFQIAGAPDLSFGTFGGSVSFIDNTDNGSGKFRILVVPDSSKNNWPPSRYLKQGVQAHGWILLNQVSIAYEIWRQFNNFPPLIPQIESDASYPSGKGSQEKKK